MTTSTLPVPIKRDSRTCFGILYFATEAEAEDYGYVAQSQTYNGGMFHGMACGRDKGFDHVGPDGTAYFAVTTA